MDKIKTAIFLHGLTGGAGQVVINYFSHMKNRNDYDIDVITLYVESEQLRQKYLDNGMNVIQIPSKKESIKRNIQAMDKLFKAKKYDIVYGHMTLTNCFPFYVAKRHGIKTRVSHSHLVSNKSFPNRLLAKATQMLSTDNLACGIEAGESLYGKSNFTVFNNAIDLDNFKYDENVRKEIRKKYKISDDEYLIGHIGRFDPQKNHIKLIDIFEEIVKLDDKAKLLLVGDGELLSKIKQKVAQKGLSKKVIFTGAVSNVPDFVQAMDVFTLPSLFEGLCLAAIEVQGNGLPCVFSDTVAVETKKLEQVSFVGLNDSPSKWAEEILNKKTVLREKNCAQILRDQGYDIKQEAQKLDNRLKADLKQSK